MNNYDVFYAIKDFKSHKLCHPAFIKALVKKCNLKNKRVLDVGCGTGKYAKLLLKEGRIVTAVDSSHVAIELAKRRYGNKIKWICSDALKLKFKNKFDALFVSGFSLYNVRDLSLAECVTAKLLTYLRKKGLLIFIYASNLRGSHFKTTVANHTLEEVCAYFKHFGNFLLATIINFQYFPIFGLSFNKFFKLLNQLALKIYKKNVHIRK